MEQEQNAQMTPELYTEEQLDAVETHITRWFGEYPTVLHEVFSPDIHVDICIIPPSPERNWVTLVTEGMGAHRMHVPEDPESAPLARAELLLCLPPDWNLDSEAEKDYWPIRLLKQLARLPLECDTWLGWGHTIDNQEPFAENTALSGSMLLDPGAYEEEACVCALPEGETVNFYQVIPLYPEEMEFKVAYGADALLDRMAGAIDHVIAPDRYNVCAPDILMVMDWEGWHVSSIREKHLPLPEIAGYNHMAIYLRWCIEHGLMSDAFQKDYPEEVASVLAGDGRTDLRELIRDELDGRLYQGIFNEEGQAFAAYYYDHGNGNDCCYPADVDDYALHYFGEKGYHSPEFQDEAYLFVPFDETYYQGMKAYLERHYADFQKEVDAS